MGMIRANDGRVIVAIPSMRKIGDNKWVVYFYENGLIHNGIYYDEERAKIKLKQVNGG